MIQAFSLERASRITGLTRRQLEYWDQTDVLRPSIAEHEIDGLPRLYSYLDLMRLQVAKHLRDRKILPSQIRRLVLELEERGFDEPLLTLRFVRVKNSHEVFWIDPRTDQPLSARSVDQAAAVWDLTLEDIRSGIEGQIAELLERKPGKVVRIRALHASQPVLDGTRVPTAKIALLAKQGWTNRRIRQEFPHLTKVDIEAALSHEHVRMTA